MIDLSLLCFNLNNTLFEDYCFVIFTSETKMQTQSATSDTLTQPSTGSETLKR